MLDVRRTLRFSYALWSLLELYKKPVLSLVTNIAGSNEVVKASKVFIKYLVALASRRQLDSRVKPSVLVLAQTCAVHILNYHRNVYKPATFF